MLPWTEWWLGDSPKALLPAQTRGLKPCFILSLLKAEERLSQWLLNWVICLNPVVCVANAEEEAKCLRSIPGDAGMDVCEGMSCPVGADGHLVADHW